MNLNETITTQIGTMTIGTAMNMLQYTPADFIGFDRGMIESYIVAQLEERDPDQINMQNQCDAYEQSEMEQGIEECEVQSEETYNEYDEYDRAWLRTFKN